MNKQLRTLIVYGGVLVALASIFVLQETVNRPRNAIEIPAAGDIHTLVFGDISLSRNGDGLWVVGEAEYPADAEKIEDFIALLDSLGPLPVVSERGHFDDYGVASDQGSAITIAGDATVSITLGDEASGGSGVYGRIDDGRSVVLLPDEFTGYRSLDPDDFREHLMAEIPEDDVRRVEIAHRSGMVTTLESRQIGAGDTIGDGTEAGTPADGPAGDASGDGSDAPMWVASGADGIGDAAYRNFFSEIASLRAQAFLDAPPAGDPLVTITVQLGGGSGTTVTVWDPDEERLFPVMVADNPYPFAIPEWRFRRLVLGVEAFVPQSSG